MTEIAISVHELSKRYRVGQRERYKALRDIITDSLAAPFRTTASLLKGETGRKGQNQAGHIWALDGVTFDVRRGEVIGIIGRNGAGKSTLLKILSRITKPTKGYADIYGRVGSLLEVGTGFHPELTGRENIALNGAILGMKKTEIERKFDEIVEFAEIEKFLDTPVKFYSSGMYMRLAFSVAAHLEPEILLVDEVLAVGDAAFQKKCLGKMGDVAQRGRTVLFVSHNMTAVRNLCQRTIWLQNGKIRTIGDTYPVTEDYLRESQKAETLDEIQAVIDSLPHDPAFRLNSIAILQKGQRSNLVLNGEPVQVEVCYTVLQPTSGLRVYFDLLDNDESILVRSFHDDDEDAIPVVQPGRYRSTATIPADLLAPRAYNLRVRGTIFNVRSCTGDGVVIPLFVEESNGIGRAYPHDTLRAKLQPKICWDTEKLDTR